MTTPRQPSLRFGNDQFTTNLFHLCCCHCCSVAESSLTLCNPMDCSWSGSSVHGILQARILEWVAISFSRGSCQPRDQTWSPALQADSLLLSRRERHCFIYNSPIWLYYFESDPKGTFLVNFHLGNWGFRRQMKCPFSALWQPRRVGWGGRWEGRWRGRGHRYTYGWFMLMFGRSQYNSVEQLSFS